MLQHHKKISLDLDKAGLIPPSGLQPLEEDATSATSSAFKFNWRSNAKAKARVKPLPSSGDLEALDASGRRSTEPADCKVQPLDVDGFPARVSLTPYGVEFTYSPKRGCFPAPAGSESVPFQEMLSVQQLDPVWRGLMQCAHFKVHRCMVFTFRRDPKERCVWSPRRLVFESTSHDAIKDFQAEVTAGIAAAGAGGCRPSHLLVIMNPNSGSRRARTIYSSIVEPVFRAAGIKTVVKETQHAGHAQQMVEALRLQDVNGIDGVVAVGGDGVFHEVFNGMLNARAAAGPELQAALMQLRVAHIPAGSTDAVACTLHGTRSVFTAAMHIALGDRTELDILRVDTAEGSTKFASCIAAYGFMGDVMAASEGFRWLGPVRYDLVGAAKLLANTLYRAKVSYLPGMPHHDPHSVCGANCPVCRAASFYRKTSSPSQPSLLLSSSSNNSSPTARPMLSSPGKASLMQVSAFSTMQPAPPSSEGGSSRGDRSFMIPVVQEPADGLLAGVARGGEVGSSSNSSSGYLQQVQLAVDGIAGPAAAPSAAAAAGAALGGSPRGHDFLQPASSAHERHRSDWRTIEGEFVSIMLIVMPCRSEKTRQGMARYGHLADGRLKLVLVKRCNAYQYLRFLMSMSATGVFPGQHPYVDVLDAVAVKVECEGQQSAWNLDGELLSTACLSAEVHQGLLEVFARGVER